MSTGQKNSSQAAAESASKISPILKPVLLAIICGSLVSSLHFVLKETVQESRLEYETKQLRELVGSEDYQIEKISENYYQISWNQEAYGDIYAIETSQGYNGRISAWLAVDKKGKVLGVRIREHKETPGIGDKIDRNISNWIDIFRGKSLSSMPEKDWRIRKDGGKFDQFTGATITPRAVVKMVKHKLTDIQITNNK